jgi:serine O-acetyltransferase
VTPDESAAVIAHDVPDGAADEGNGLEDLNAVGFSTTTGLPPGMSLWALLKEDYETHRRSLSMPGFHGLALYRVMIWGNRRRSPAIRVLLKVCRILNNVVVRNVYGLEMYPTSMIGRRVIIGHHQGVVLGEFAVIGDDCVIRQNVTLGLANPLKEGEQQPRLGKNVTLGAGATLVGGITIGDDVQIGPGAVVMSDVPAGARVFAPPARVMKASPPTGTAAAGG